MAYNLPNDYFVRFEIFKYFGKLSYVIYLLHLTIFNLLKTYIGDFSLGWFITIVVFFSLITMKIFDNCCFYFYERQKN